MSDEGKKALRCSFCGKREQQVHRMIQGPGVRICDECVHPSTYPLSEWPMDTSHLFLRDRELTAHANIYNIYHLYLIFVLFICE